MLLSVVDDDPSPLLRGAAGQGEEAGHDCRAEKDGAEVRHQASSQTGVSEVSAQCRAKSQLARSLPLVSVVRNRAPGVDHCRCA